MNFRTLSLSIWVFGAALFMGLLIYGCSNEDHVAGPVSVYPSNVWRHQNPIPTSNNLLDIEFISPWEVWACGTAGSLLHSVDQGQTWVESFVLPATAMDLFFLDENNGWAVGGNGMIAFTDDGGRSWRQQYSGTIELISTVTFLNLRDGWAATTSGSVLRTANGGRTWRRLSTGVCQIYDLLMLDLSEGWVVGRTGLTPSGAGLFHTSDGGITWVSVDPGIPGDLGPDYPGAYVSVRLNSIASPVTGMLSVVGESVVWDGIGGITLFSDDGGSTWTYEFTNAILYGLTFTSNGTGWACGFGGVIERSDDSGRTWHRQQAFGWSFQNLKMYDDQAGCAVGEAGIIVATIDGGTTWNRISESSRSILSDIQFIDQEHGWAAGFGGVLVTKDGGESWQQTGCTANETVQFFDINHGLACDYNGNLDATHDGGSTWVRIKNAIESRVWGMCFVDTLRGWVCGTPAILRSDDGGRNWAVQWTGVGLNGICFVDTSRGWAVGGRGTIVNTADGGRHWNIQPSQVTTVLQDVVFIDSLRGWVVGGSSTILATTDGGQHWSPQNPGTDGTSYFDDVQFIDATTGWVAGFAGLVLATTDSGRSWIRQFSPTSNHLIALSAVDKDHVWAAGFNGTIITTAPRRK